MRVLGALGTLSSVLLLKFLQRGTSSQGSQSSCSRTGMGWGELVIPVCPAIAVASLRTREDGQALSASVGLEVYV